MKTAQSWYSPKSSNHQGTIVSEPDGRTVAVAYDKADAPLLAAAPLLLNTVILLLHQLEAIECPATKDGLEICEARAKARAAIFQAKGES